MRGVFWNTDGLGDRGKHLSVNEIVREHRLDFIALLESGRSKFATPMERWQKKRHIRQFLRGLAKNKSGEYKLLRDKLLLLIDELISEQRLPLLVSRRGWLRERKMIV